jgi:hypothetical protein
MREKLDSKLLKKWVDAVGGKVRVDDEEAK